MKRNIAFILITLIFITYRGAKAQTDKPPLLIPYNSTVINLDGNLEDWPESFTYSFEDTLTKFRETPLYKYEDVYPPGITSDDIKHPRSSNKATVNIFWNLTHLNIAVIVFDKHLFAQVDQYGEKPSFYMNDGVEIYVDSKNDSKNKMDINDYQFIIDINKNSTVYRGDRRLMQRSDYSVPKDFDQNVLFKHSVRRIGSVNNDSDLDSMYVVEISIPFAAIGIEPETGWNIKLDVCVNDVDHFTSDRDIIDYVSLSAFPFNWSGYSDFGYPSFWKKATLIGSPGFFESISRQYSRSWLTFYLITLLLALVIVSYLFYKIRRLRKIPSKEEVDHAAVIFIPAHEVEEELSYNQRILKDATNHIVKNKNKNVHSEDVANITGLSLRTFQRITKEELNCTPTNFINIVKLNLAAEYLSKNIGNVTEAAYEFGFSDPSYFSKLFKNHFGHSPSDHTPKNDKNM